MSWIVYLFEMIGLILIASGIVTAYNTLKMKREENKKYEDFAKTFSQCEQNALKGIKGLINKLETILKDKENIENGK